MDDEFFAKALLFALGSRRVGYIPSLARTAGGALPAILLSQLLYHHRNAGSWDMVALTQKEWTSQTGMTRANLKTARKALKNRNLINEMVAGAPPVVLMQVAREELSKAFGIQIAEAAHVQTSTIEDHARRRAGTEHDVAPEPSKTTTSRCLKKKKNRENEGRAEDSPNLFSDIQRTPEKPKTTSAAAGRPDFELGWRESIQAGTPRPGPKANGKPKSALAQWGRLLKASGWSPQEALNRWRAFMRFREVEFWPQTARLLNPDNEHLTDDSLSALERAHGARLKADDTRAYTPPAEERKEDPQVAANRAERLRRAAMTQAERDAEDAEKRAALQALWDERQRQRRAKDLENGAAE